MQRILLFPDLTLNNGNWVLYFWFDEGIKGIKGIKIKYTYSHNRHMGNG